MARKYEMITELYHRTVAGLTVPSVWQNFLNTACHNFRLPFDEQVLLFAQRPDATAVWKSSDGTGNSGAGSTGVQLGSLSWMTAAQAGRG